MDPLSHNLADALAKRLNALMPAQFRLTPKSGRLVMQVNGRVDGIITTPEIADEQSRELAERLDTAVYGVLNSVQDTIATRVRLPWPSESTRNMARPGVRVGADAIYLWYGDSENAPVMSIPKIPLKTIGARGRL
jgi:hypothetical protein